MQFRKTISTLYKLKNDFASATWSVKSFTINVEFNIILFYISQIISVIIKLKPLKSLIKLDALKWVNFMPSDISINKQLCLIFYHFV